MSEGAAVLVLVLDVRERDLIDLATKRAPGAFAVETLSVGDAVYRWVGADGSSRTALLVERKRTDDLEHSVVDGRLESQAAGLRAADLDVFIVEERWVAPPGAPPSPISWEQRRGAVLAAQLDGRIGFYPTSGLGDTLALLLQLYKMLARRGPRGRPTQELAALGKDARRRVALKGKGSAGVVGLVAMVPRLGERRATRVIKTFGTLGQLARTKRAGALAALLQMDGVGKGLADSILAALHVE